MSDTDTLERPKGKTAATAPGMKVTIERAALLAALGHVAGIVERTVTIPVLSNVLIEAEADGRVTLTGTDLVLQVRESLPASVDQPGETTVSASVLFDIARELPEGAQVSLALGDGRLAVSAARCRYNLATLPRDQFPVLATADAAQTFKLPAATLRGMLARTAFAICTETARDYLGGVHFTVLGDGKGSLVAAATNGHCLAEVAVPAPKGAAGMAGSTVPRKAVGQLIKLLDGLDGDVEIEVSEKRIRVVAGDVEISSKLVEGSFPDWRRVMPTAPTLVLQTHAEALGRGVRRVRLIASERTRAVRIGFGRDRLSLSVTSPENGTASEEVPAAYDGAEIDVGFNAAYLLDTLAAMGATELEIGLNDAVAPALFTNPADKTTRWVIMPMRV